MRDAKSIKVSLGIHPWEKDEHSRDIPHDTQLLQTIGELLLDIREHLVIQSEIRNKFAL